MQGKLIGRVTATEKYPTTMDSFTFWTDPDLRLGAFDIVKAEHIDGSYTFGSIRNISHITDAQSFLAGYISCDFGDLEAQPPTLRVGMNYAEASVSFNTKNIYTPVRNDSPVYLASPEEIIYALGLANVQNPIVCGSLTMYEGTEDEITLPVRMNAKFLLGPEGAHLNISGISGLAAKTSYSMFLLKAIQEYYSAMSDETAAFVIFNVKGRDLTAIDIPGGLSEAERGRYEALGLSAEPFRNVKYYIPYSHSGRSTYIAQDDIEGYARAGRLLKYKYCYTEDRDSLGMLFANVDDPLQTMESIIAKITDEKDSDFGGGQVTTWEQMIQKVNMFSQKSQGKSGAANEISVLSWRKFGRILGTSVNHDDMFANRAVRENHECRLADELKAIQPGDVRVIDIAKLSEDKQAFVFGDSLRTIYDIKLGEYEGTNPPSRIIVFIDELNKYASKDAPKSSPVLRKILDVTERGRSLGVIVFGAEQFRSAIHPRVTGNCAVHAYGRTNSTEVSGKDYSHIPETYRNILLRLEQGEYLLQSPVFRSLLKVKFPRPVYRQFND
ncbi:MAG: ATP-binding protein [Synergistaceae bacterium]|nr:ATP-binding protein [Synergistaceae bacterium]MBQ6972883.1 ATP-binding protein [Synergistaceae bacterium]